MLKACEQWLRVQEKVSGDISDRWETSWTKPNQQLAGWKGKWSNCKSPLGSVIYFSYMEERELQQAWRQTKEQHWESSREKRCHQEDARAAATTGLAPPWNLWGEQPNLHPNSVFSSKSPQPQMLPPQQYSPDPCTSIPWDAFPKNITTPLESPCGSVSPQNILQFPDTLPTVRGRQYPKTSSFLPTRPTPMTSSRYCPAR